MILIAVLHMHLAFCDFDDLWTAMHLILEARTFLSSFANYDHRLLAMM